MAMSTKPTVVLHAEILLALATTEGVRPGVRLALLSEAAELVSGKQYPVGRARSTAPKPRSGDWVTPSQIGDEIGIPPGTVGRCLKLAGLHGSQDRDRGWSRVNGVNNKVKSPKSYLYDRSVVTAVVGAIHEQRDVFDVAARFQARRELRR